MYTQYVGDYLQPWVQELRLRGKLKRGKKKIHIKGVNRYFPEEGEDWDYEGELDQDGLACGMGELSNKDGNHSYTGCFVNDKFEGIGVYAYPNEYRRNDDDTFDGEWKNGLKHGKITFHDAGGAASNALWKNGKGLDTMECARKEHCFYREGEPLKAFEDDWREFV